MKIIDTHAHIFVEQFEEDIEGIILRAKSIGVEKILLPNIDETTIKSVISTVERFPDICLPMMGLHPTNISSNWEEQLNTIYKELNSNNTYIAIGEIGIDLHWDKTNIDIQKEVFEKQLKWSIEKDLPVSIHSREAIHEVVESIKKIGDDSLHGIFHSFGGNEKELEDVLSLTNFYIGINGVVTFKNSGLDKVLEKCPLERIVIETDSPWLAPVPNRGKRNEPSFIIDVVKKLSLIYGISEIEIANRTTYNARKAFII